MTPLPPAAGLPLLAAGAAGFGNEREGSLRLHRADPGFCKAV